MSLQLVYLNCAQKPFKQAGRVHEVWEHDLATEQLASPRLNFMFGKPREAQSNALAFKNLDVVYIHYGSEPLYKDVYDFMFSCRANSSCRNRFFLGTTEEFDNITFEALLSGAHDYHPASGGKVPSPAVLRGVKPLLMQGAHILHEWRKRGFLESRKNILLVSGVLMETECSKGQHVIMHKNEGWLFNTSTPFIAMLIDYYLIEGNFGGPNSQLNFASDAEFRLLVATYLFDTLKAFCVENPSGRGLEPGQRPGENPLEQGLGSGEQAFETVDDVVRGVLSLTRSA